MWYFLFSNSVLFKNKASNFSSVSFFYFNFFNANIKSFIFYFLKKLYSKNSSITCSLHLLEKQKEIIKKRSHFSKIKKFFSLLEKKFQLKKNYIFFNQIYFKALNLVFNTFLSTNNFNFFFFKFLNN